MGSDGPMVDCGPGDGLVFIGRLPGVTPYARAIWIGMDPVGPTVLKVWPPSRMIGAHSVVRVGASGGGSGEHEDSEQTEQYVNKWA